MPGEMYIDGSYLKAHPTWDTEDSPWKAQQIIRMMERNNIAPRTICEVGCGAGEILNQLQGRMNKKCIYCGYEISPQAFELAKSRANERLQFKLGDFLQEEDVFFDLILLIDVIEHVEDYFSFLRRVKSKSRYKILHIPLDLSVQHVLRVSPIVEKWEAAGHIHFFTKEIALHALKDVGYEVLDYFYTAWSIERPAMSIKSYVIRPLRRLFFAINEGLAVRTMGGYSLLVLAE